MLTKSNETATTMHCLTQSKEHTVLFTYISVDKMDGPITKQRDLESELPFFFMTSNQNTIPLNSEPIHYTLDINK